MADAKITALSDSGAIVASTDEFVIARSGNNYKVAPERIGIALASAKRTSSVSTTGITFAAGADVLASALSFTADGSSDYLVTLRAPSIRNATANDGAALHLNLDGSDAGTILQAYSAGASQDENGDIQGIIVAPSAGSHTLNLRLRALGGGTASLQGGPGGSGQFSPIHVSVRRVV